jgi:dTDP-4-dehydrorhamnose 3,5-epimerase-like enzyme
MLLVPQGFAHGFITLENDCEVQYKVDKIYNKSSERSIKYNDPKIGIKWPSEDVILSEKDQNAPLLNDLDVNFV